MDARQQEHPNLKKGGRNPRAGRPRKSHRDRFAAIRDAGIGVLEELMAETVAEVKAAKKAGKKPKVDLDRLLKVVETAAKNAEGGAKEQRDPVPAIGLEDLNDMIDKVYGDKEVGDDAQEA